MESIHRHCVKVKSRYQVRKKKKTTNLLFLTDKQRIPIEISHPISERHNDMFHIEKHFNQSLSASQKAKINTAELFLNAYGGFDCKELRKVCFQHDINPNFSTNSRNSKDNTKDYIFDKELYRLRFSIERINAWIDSYRNVLNRIGYTELSWYCANTLRCIVILLNEINKNKSPDDYFIFYINCKKQYEKKNHLTT